MNLIQFCATSSYLVVSKLLIQKIGPIEALVFSELASEYEYWKSQDKLNDGWFFSTVENIENNTGLSLYHQRVAINKLIELGLIEKQQKGMPAKRFFRINETKLLSLFDSSSSIHSKHQDVEYLETRCKHSIEQDVEYLETNNNNINNNDKNNKSSMTHLSATNKNPFDITLKNKQREEKEIKKTIKNKTELIEKGLLDEMVPERMSTIDNDEVQKNRLAAAERAAERAARANTAKNKNIKKARLRTASEMFPEKETLDLLGEFIDSYLFSYNPMSEQSWKCILEDIANIPDDKRNKAIRDSIASGYRKIVYNEYNDKNIFDNTRNHIVDKKALHEFSEEDKEALDKSLARNADGTYMIF